MKTTLYRIGTTHIICEIVYGAGESRPVEVTEDTLRANIDRGSLYLSGGFDIYNEAGEVITRRRSGDWSGDGNDAPKGRYTMRSIENGSTHICFQTRSGDPLQAECFRPKAGEWFSVPQGSVFYLGRGEVDMGGNSRQARYSVKADIGPIEGYAVTDASSLVVRV